VAAFGVTAQDCQRLLTSLQQQLVKMGGRLLKHARYYWLLLAESRLILYGRRLLDSEVRLVVVIETNRPEGGAETC
jgi:hypothetical protein